MQVKDHNRSRRSVASISAICFVCQFVLAPNIALGNGHPNFAFVCAALIALTVGGQAGVVGGFVCGLVYDLTATSPLGLMAGLLTIAAFVLGGEVRDRMVEDHMATIIPVGIAAFAVSLIYHLAMYVVGLEASLVDLIFLRTLPTALLTLIAYLPFAFGVGRRHGGSGPTLGGSSRGGSHYALPTR